MRGLVLISTTPSSSSGRIRLLGGGRNKCTKLQKDEDRRSNHILFILQLLDQVWNRSIQVVSVDCCEETTEHANAEALTIQHEANLCFRRTNSLELMIIMDGDPQEWPHPPPVTPLVEFGHSKSGSYAIGQSDIAFRVESHGTRRTQIDPANVASPARPLLDSDEVIPSLIQWHLNDETAFQ